MATNPRRSSSMCSRLTTVSTAVVTTASHQARCLRRRSPVASSSTATPATSVSTVPASPTAGGRPSELRSSPPKIRRGAGKTAVATVSSATRRANQTTARTVAASVSRRRASGSGTTVAARRGGGCSPGSVPVASGRFTTASARVRDRGRIDAGAPDNDAMLRSGRRVRAESG
ncbi:MAG: hypothetical protein L0I76_22820 [Pseudonocardia sp.]|nr:hypothetical protein [Pseudonocardia sp.]